MSLSNISVKTLNMLDKSVLSAKETVIKDIYDKYLKNTNITLEDMLKQFLEREIPRKRKLIKRPRKIIDCCIAKIWKADTKEYSRCKFNKLENLEYCGLHKNKQNYGNF